MAAGQLSIGEVLAQLQREFPDVTISKIRFLESQGLISPERTTSGYRKFSDDDLSALRWILTQQRDHFLPLRVIKERLEQGAHFERAAPPTTLQPVPTDPAALEVLTGGAAASEAPARSAQPERIRPEPTLAAVPDSSFGATPDREPFSEPSETEPDDNAPAANNDVPDAQASSAEEAPSQSVLPESSPFEPAGTSLALGATTVSMTIEELASASGLSIPELRELESYRLLTSSSDSRYDGQALIVANAAAGFRDYGVEPRHLRMFLTAAERESGLYEQAAMAVAQRRGPEVRRETRETLEHLVQLGDRLRGAMLRETLASHLG
jgi:DNA-binding transcriptional MerR regulator